MRNRHLSKVILQDLERKIVILSGPRQCGKTTLSKSLFSDYDYLNYDFSKDRERLRKHADDPGKSIIIFDELHKLHRCKAYKIIGIKPQGKPWTRNVLANSYGSVASRGAIN